MSNSIKINGKELESFGFTTTGACFLLGIGHAYHSAKRDSSSTARKIDATEEHHNDLIGHVESIDLWLSDSIQAVGAALAALKYDEINENSIADLGYLVSGLGDLQKAMNESRIIVEESKGASA